MAAKRKKTRASKGKAASKTGRGRPKAVGASPEPVDMQTGVWAAWFLALLIPLVGVLAVLVLLLANSPVLPTDELIGPGIFLVCWLGVSVLLWPIGAGGDRLVAAAAMALCGLGVAMSFRMGTGGGFSFSQLAFPLGCLGLLLCAGLFRNGRLNLLRGVGWAAWVGAVSVIVAVLVLGHRMRGAVFFPGGMNPTELAKLLLVLWLAFFLSQDENSKKRRPGGVSRLCVLALAWSIPMGLLLLQRDLGLIVILCVVLIVMLYVATGRLGYLVAGLVASVALFSAGTFLPVHVQARFAAWRDPFADATGRGWQIVHSLSALYSGGLWGEGIGAGAPQSVPIVESDFVYAAIAEELGFVACGAILLVYFFIMARGFAIGRAARTRFVELFCKGIATVLGIQVLVNVGGVTKAIPVTGVTLPFISLGGSSMVVSLVMIGMLVAASVNER